MPTIERESKSAVNPGDVVSGLTFVGLGVALWLYRQGQIDGIDLSTYWPIALMLWGVAQLVARPRCDGSGGVVLLVVGAFLLINNLGYASWPLALVAVGVVLVWRGWRDDGATNQGPNKGSEVES